jgi:hypothetical protein
MRIMSVPVTAGRSLARFFPLTSGWLLCVSDTAGRSLARFFPLTWGWLLCVSVTARRWRSSFSRVEGGSCVYRTLQGAGALLSADLTVAPECISHCRALALFFPPTWGWLLCASVTAGRWRSSFRRLEGGSWVHQSLQGAGALLSADLRVAPECISYCRALARTSRCYLVCDVCNVFCWNVTSASLISRRRHDQSGQDRADKWVGRFRICSISERCKKRRN